MNKDLIRMILIFSLAGSTAFSCPKEWPLLENPYNLPLTRQDKQALSSAMKRCKVHYSKSPCLKKFIIVNHGTYRAICAK